MPAAKTITRKSCKVPQANSNVYHYNTVVYLILGRVQESDQKGECQDVGLLVENWSSALLGIKAHA